MRFSALFLLLPTLMTMAHGQTKMDRALQRYNRGSVPYVQVQEVTPSEDILLLDTREHEEYAVSHLQDAHWVGHKDFDAEEFTKEHPDRQRPIIVYCSIGVRSENIGEALQELGYTHVKNLYGGIFAWKNENHTVYNGQGQPTDSVHAFNKQWGKLLQKGTKVYTGPKK